MRPVYTWHQRHVFKGFGIDFACECRVSFCQEFILEKIPLKKV